MRIPALDSLRGIAAFSVVIYHSMLVFPAFHAILDGRGVPYAVSGRVTTLLLTVTPPSLFWAGREAVLLFFVLSGFVLTLAFDGDGGRRSGWLAFATKRTVRLLLPCAVVAVVLAVLVPLINPLPRPELSDWFNGSWADPVTPGMMLRHALLMETESYPLNNPMWTLHYELRISLLFPLLVLLATAGGTVLAAATIAGVLLCLVAMKFLGIDALTTLLFVPYFALGTLLARHRQAIGTGIAGFGTSARAGLWLGCYLLLTFRWLVPAGDLVCDFANGAGSALLIALILGSHRLQSALQAAPLLRLGAISYSLYLVHVPVLLAALHLLPRDVPPLAVAIAAPILSVLVAMGLYRLVEQPSIVLGRRAAAWVDGHWGRPRPMVRRA
jgi:peptidoglycan/LPS O-acetylase OafA/YrhL